MANKSARVMVLEVNETGATYKVTGALDDGSEREFTQHKVDKRSGDANEPPQAGELVMIEYGEQAGEWNGQPQLTYWLNNWGMAQPRPDERDNNTPPPPIEQEQPQERDTPQKAAYEDRQDRTQASIQMTMALETAREQIPYYDGDLTDLVKLDAHAHATARYATTLLAYTYGLMGQPLEDEVSDGEEPEREFTG